MARGVGGMAGTVRRGRIIIHDRCRMAAVQDTAATGDIVRRTIGHPCRRIDRGTAVLAMVSRVTVQAVQVMEVPEAGREGRVLELLGIDRAIRGTGIAQALLGIVQELLEMEIVQGMGIVQALRGIAQAILEMEIVPERRGTGIVREILELLGMGIVQELQGTGIDPEVVRAEAVRRSRGRVENPHHSLVLHNRTVPRRSLVRLRGQRNLVPHRRRGLRRAVLVRSLVLRARADLRNSLGRLGGRHRAHSQTVAAASRTRLCL